MDSAPETDVSPAFPFERRKVKVLGAEMSYIDTQPEAQALDKPTALFLHGNGSSSYLWRNIIPHVASSMRCVAPDLIGMGYSEKFNNLPYRITDHYTFLSSFIRTIIPNGPVLLVVHDWGSALGLHWAQLEAENSSPLNPPRVLGLVMMEFVLPFPTWESFGTPELQKMFKVFRDPVEGRKLIKDENYLLDKLAPWGQIRQLTAEEIKEKNRPFPTPASREPMFVFTTQIPIEGKPSDVWDMASRYQDWLTECETPKLVFHGRPGSIVSEDRLQWCLQNFKNLTTVDLGQIMHYPQEDHPRAIGTGIHQWLNENSSISKAL